MDGKKRLIGGKIEKNVYFGTRRWCGSGSTGGMEVKRRNGAVSAIVPITSWISCRNENCVERKQQSFNKKVPL